jgi:hypothetical protein
MISRYEAKHFSLRHYYKAFYHNSAQEETTPAKNCIFTLHEV